MFIQNQALGIPIGGIHPLLYAYESNSHTLKFHSLLNVIKLSKFYKDNDDTSPSPSSHPDIVLWKSELLPRTKLPIWGK